MLRTFISNPILGGFAGESSTSALLLSSSSSSSSPQWHDPAPDAFCQIIKELIDNAVDACTVDCHLPPPMLLSGSGQNVPTTATAMAAVGAKKKRVRVVIEACQQNRRQTLPQQHDDDDDDANDGDDDQSCGDNDKNKDEPKAEILRVMVSDNGCGMEDIQACIGAFHTSKAHNSATTSSSSGSKSQNQSSAKKVSSNGVVVEAQTAGRYGIGLTLCLLHAQRLVPNSCAFIQSARATDPTWTVVTAVVDAEQDIVQCVNRPSLPKSFPSESGTSISILVPGGATATLAWPRLAEYFARFKLSLGIPCNLEVRAPTLSRIPLFVEPTIIIHNGDRPNSDKAHKSKVLRKPKKQGSQKLSQGENSQDGDENDIFDEKWLDMHQDEEELQKSDHSDDDDNDTVNSTPPEPVSAERRAIWKATEQFLGHSVELRNVAHAVVPIRTNSTKGRATAGPQLEVDVIVQGPRDEGEDEDLQNNLLDDDDDDDDMSQDCDLDLESNNRGNSLPIKNSEDQNKAASMVLIRMVNKIPLLDSAEAVACGLVQGLSSKKRMWNSFGLNVNLKVEPSNVKKLLTFEVTDSEQVTPFFKSGAHNLLEQDDETDTESEKDIDDSDSVDIPVDTVPKRKRHKRPYRNLLPASVRLGNILVIAQIHAEPTTLPLPTLSKGRLPLDNKAIDDALEIGMTKCLSQLQKTNPSLLLTTTELRKAERDARYVPAVALALSSILTKSVTEPDPTVLDRIHKWNTATAGIPSKVVPMSDCSSQHSIASSQSNQADRNGKEFSTQDVVMLGRLIEERLRFVITHAETNKETSKRTKKKERIAAHEAEKENEASEASPKDDNDDDDTSFEGLDVDWDLLQQQFEITNNASKRSNQKSVLLGNGADKFGAEEDCDSDDDDNFEDWL